MNAKPPPLPTPAHQNAAYALIAAAFFAGLILALILSLGTSNKIDTVGLVFISIIGLVFLCTSAAATLLLMRKKLGIVLCWICVPLLVLNFPIGTLIAFYVAIQIGKPEVREYIN